MNMQHRATMGFPEKALPLFDPSPYKVFHGGRGSGKTHSFCRALLTLGARRKLFILCAREIQKSIADSVHKTLADIIDDERMHSTYKVTKNHIISDLGTRFTFAGIKNNITSIKSMEAIDICAVFEATFVSHHSWEVLLPTIRRDPPFGPFEQGSEIWVEFNPELATDETYKRWVAEPPDGTIVVEMNFRDNPWFPKILEKQKDDLKARDYDSYLTVWEGKTRKTLEGAIYSREISKAVTEGRINPHVLIDRSKPVSVSFDLGKADTCSMWFWQQIGMQHHAVDYYGNVGFDFSHYIEQIQDRKYIIGKVYLPHDAAHGHISAVKSVEQQAREVWPNDGQVQVNPPISNITLGINLVRTLFPRIHIHELKCADGIMALQHYQFGTDPDKLDGQGRPERTQQPVHNWASHPADALRTYAEGLRDPDQALRPQRLPERPSKRGQSWLGV